ncbi:MAG: FxsA family protein [Spirochaetaceae bacterium]
MHRTKGLLRLFEPGFVSRLFLALLLLSILGIADGYILLTLGEHYGKYLVLAATASTGLAALFFLVNSAGDTLARIRREVSADIYPGREYARLAGLIVAGVLLLLPGFFTDALGLVVYLPPIRRLTGHALTARHGTFLREAYEYLKIGDV